MNRIIEIIATVAVIVVIGAVLLGIFRLALDNLSYIIFFIVAVVAAIYLFKQSR